MLDFYIPKCIWSIFDWNKYHFRFQPDHFAAKLNDGQLMDSEFIDDITTVDFDVTFEHVLNTCKIKERIDQEDIETVFDNTLPTTQTEKCFVACWLEQFHVVSERYKCELRISEILSPNGV